MKASPQWASLSSPPRAARVLLAAASVDFRARLRRRGGQGSRPDPARRGGTRRPPCSAVPASNAAQRNYLEDAFTFTPLRDSLAVPFPPPTPASWEDRLFFDSRDEWNLGNNVTLDL